MAEPNGLTKGRPSTRLGNGKAAMPSRRSGAPASRSWRSRLFNTVARLLTWYAIITILFRCPSTLEECDETSPVLCKAYFNTRDVVIPHVEPYYDTYAAPYVDRARPYVDTVSTRVVAPTRVVLERYAAPKLQQAKEFAQAHWATTGQPQVDKARELVTENYVQNVAPHVEKLSEAVGPYRDIAQASAMETYHDVILPSYEFVKPYAVSAYDVSCTVTTETVVPAVVYAFNETYVFMDGNVWPHLRAVYVQSVEPQLVRIGERLGRYKDSGNNGTAKKNVPASQSSDEAEESSFVKPSQSVTPSEAAEKKDATSSSTSETVSSADATPSSAGESDVENQKKPSRDEIRRIASETVEEDLHQWETKFATAAEEGANDIEDKVNELSADMYKSGIQGEGESLVRELESVAEEQIEGLKQAIISLVESPDFSDAAGMKEAATAAVRAAGLAIKEKAEGVRSWREEFEFELRATVTSNAQEHFNILGSMRDLALQKLGMKWAWMDGVTYKDWAKYHGMKKKFDEWTQELQELIVTNPSLETAMNGAADLEDRAMEIAQNAAIKLGELKQVAAWKIDAADATDNFDADEMEQAALAAAAPNSQSDESQVTNESANNADAESESVISDGSSAGHEEEVHVDTAPEVEPEEEPEPVEGEAAESGEAHDNEDANPPEPAEAEPDLNEEEKDVPVAEAEAAESEEEPAEDVSASGSDDLKTEKSAESEEQVDAGNQEEASSADDSDDASPEASEELESVILGAGAQMVMPEDAIADASAGLEWASEKATAAADYLHSEVLEKASNILSQATSSISEQLEVTPEVDADDLISSASSAFSESVESAESELSSAYEVADSMLEGEGETSAAAEESVEQAESSTVAEDPEALEPETRAFSEKVSDEVETPVADEQPEAETAAAEQASEEEGAQEATSEEESLLWEDDAAASQAGEKSDERDEL